MLLKSGKRIFIDQEGLTEIEKLRKNYYYRQHSLEWLINRAVLKYARSKLGLLEYIDHRKSTIIKLLEKQMSICPYCYETIQRKGATIDHKIPQSDEDGGEYHVFDPENFVVVHERCNHLKGRMKLETWLDFQRHVTIRVRPSVDNDIAIQP